MKQNKTYLHLGVTLIVSACAVLMFYDTFSSPACCWTFSTS